jgi:hypothetical protein
MYDSLAKLLLFIFLNIAISSKIFAAPPKNIFPSRVNTLVICQYSWCNEGSKIYFHPPGMYRNNDEFIYLNVEIHGDVPIQIVDIRLFDTYGNKLTLPMYVNGIPLNQYLKGRTNLHDPFTIMIYDEHYKLLTLNKGTIKIIASSSSAFRFTWAVYPWEVIDSYQDPEYEIHVTSKQLSFQKTGLTTATNRRAKSKTTLNIEVELPTISTTKTFLEEGVFLGGTDNYELYNFDGVENPGLYFDYYPQFGELERRIRIPDQIQYYLQQADEVEDYLQLGREFQITDVIPENINNNNRHIIGARVNFHIHLRNTRDAERGQYVLYMMNGYNIPPSDETAGFDIVEGPISINGFTFYLFRLQRYEYKNTFGAPIIDSYYADINWLFQPFGLLQFAKTNLSTESEPQTFHSLILNDGKVYCYGYNTYNQCDSSGRSYIPYDAKVQIMVFNNGGLVTISSVLATRYGSFFASTSGAVYAMGCNGASGQHFLGLPDNVGTKEGIVQSPTKLNIPSSIESDGFITNKHSDNRYNYPDMVMLHAKNGRIIAFGLGIDGATIGSLPKFVTLEGYKVNPFKFVNTQLSSCYEAEGILTDRKRCFCFRYPLYDGHILGPFYLSTSPYEFACPE